MRRAMTMPGSVESEYTLCVEKSSIKSTGNASAISNASQPEKVMKLMGDVGANDKKINWVVIAVFNS
jgi:hypothetical protein